MRKWWEALLHIVFSKQGGPGSAIFNIWGGGMAGNYMGELYRPGLEVGYITSCLHSIGQKPVTWEAGKCSPHGSQRGNGVGK